MVRHAEWRPFRNDPGTAGVWLFRSLVTPARVAVLGSIGLIAATILTGNPVTWLLCVLCMFLSAVMAHLHWGPLHPGVAELTPSIRGVDQFRVQVSIRDRGVLLGQDQGTISFVDGWLYFEGLRTTFALQETDVRQMKRGSNRSYGLALPDHATLVLRAEYPAPFNGALIGWRTDGQTPMGIAPLPPNQPHRSALAEPMGQLIVGFVLTMLAGWATYAISIAPSRQATEGLIVIAVFGSAGLAQLGRGLRSILFLLGRFRSAKLGR